MYFDTKNTLKSYRNRNPKQGHTRQRENKLFRLKGEPGEILIKFPKKGGFDLILSHPPFSSLSTWFIPFASIKIFFHWLKHSNYMFLI